MDPKSSTTPQPKSDSKISAQPDSSSTTSTKKPSMTERLRAKGIEVLSVEEGFRRVSQQIRGDVLKSAAKRELAETKAKRSK